MKLQIVIPVLNLWTRYTLPCLASIRASIEHRVVVIDNASTDQTEVEARKLVNGGFVYHRNPANLGVARAWNDGCRDAFENGYDMALVLNNDVLLHPECIDRLVERISKDPAVGLVTPVDVCGDCCQPSDVFAFDADARRSTPEMNAPDFAAFLLTKTCWEKAGAFDEAFNPAYFEDNDYHYRICLAGLRAIALPPAIFYHFGSRTQNEANDGPIVDAWMFEKNRGYYVRKWGGPPGCETFREPFGG